MIGALVLAGAVLIARMPGSWHVPVRRGARGRPGSDLADLTRLLAIAAAAGLPLGAALEAAERELEGPLAGATGDVVRAARTRGLTAALLAAPALGPLGPALARAHAAGAPLAQTLEAHLAAHRTERTAVALERARTAPVRIMVPLALLLLPGFTALVVGPTLLDHLLDVTSFGR